jgi:hypothetical protein
LPRRDGFSEACSPVRRQVPEQQQDLPLSCRQETAGGEVAQIAFEIAQVRGFEEQLGLRNRAVGEVCPDDVFRPSKAIAGLPGAQTAGRSRLHSLRCRALATIS